MPDRQRLSSYQLNVRGDRGTAVIQNPDGVKHSDN